MDIDPLELTEEDETEDAGDKPEKKSKRQLNAWVAVTVALLATFLGICNVKDDNIVQGMQQAQADKIDNWSFYQARNVREEIANLAVTQLRLESAPLSGPRRASYAAKIKTYEALAKDQHAKKEAIRSVAENDQKTYDALNYHDDQFDLSSALIAIAISMLAVASLTQKRWLFALAMIPSVLGVWMGLAGLFGWRVHSDLIARLLS
jgi:hypothetical protein